MRALSPFYYNQPKSSWDLFEDFERLVENLIQPSMSSSNGFRTQPYEVNETKDHFLVSFDMPGMKMEDIKIEVKDDQLTISGERKFESKTLSQSQRSYGQFHRTFVLPKSIDAEKIEAQYESGVLNIAVPKTEAAKAKVIPVKTGSTSLLSRFLPNKKEEAKELKDTKQKNVS